MIRRNVLRWLLQTSLPLVAIAALGAHASESEVVLGFRLHFPQAETSAQRVGLNDGVMTRWSFRGWAGPIRMTASRQGKQSKIVVELRQGSSWSIVKTAVLSVGEVVTLREGHDVPAGYFGGHSGSFKVEFLGDWNVGEH